ncbi:MAG: hypothetical protein ACI8RZ_005253 [Myxococcota bacterium]|jgi:hypothetical protein
MVRWLVETWATMWGWAEGRIFASRQRLAASALREEAAGLEAGVRQLGSGALALVGQVWDQLDELPFVHKLLPIKPVHRQLYAHGAFMGAAPALLADVRWRRILAFLMPDVHEDVSAALADGARPAVLIPMFENNPVMCAFGLWRSLTGQADREAWEFELVGVEWDLFIDGDLAEAHAMAGPQAQKGIAARILQSAVIAHASTTDTLQEAFGVCQHVDVRKTRKTQLGGLEIAAWLDLFARAMMLRRAEKPRAMMVEMARLPRVQLGEQCRMHTFVDAIPVGQAVDLFTEITGRSHFSIVLEIKSLRSTPALLADLIDALNHQGIHVAAACSFSLPEVTGLAQHTQTVREATLPGPREVLFFHFAGDLQRACDDGAVPPGISVLFNGASLLEEDPEEIVGPYRIMEAVVDGLSAYKAKYRIHIGLYVQEGDCDSAAAERLSALVARSDDPFDLGFAWGGLREEVAIEAGEEPRLGYGTQRRLLLVGQAHLWEVRSEALR